VTGGVPFFSEYVEGTSNNKALEVGVTGGRSVHLTGCQIRIFLNGSNVSQAPIALAAGVLPAGEVWVVCNPAANASRLALCNQASSGINFNGDDAVLLACGSSTLDIIGQLGFDPGIAWGVAPNTTLNATLVRKCSVVEGDLNGSDAYDPIATEWLGLAVDSFAGLGSPDCAP